MRTVTFADPKVVEYLNEHYVVVWNDHNSEREGSGEQPKYTRAEIEAYPEGGGGTNLVTYFVAADGSTLAQIEGWWSPERYLEEATWALHLNKEKARDQLAERNRALKAEAEKLAADHPEEMKRPVQDSPIRRKIAAIGILMQWHETSRAMKHDGIVAVLEALKQSCGLRVIK